MTAFQRDSDRVIHSKSFRRLKHKTQVFLSPFGDHYRTRLTKILTDLFEYFLKNPGDYIKQYPERDTLDESVGDFIAGMTDRYAMALYEEIFFPSSWT